MAELPDTSPVEVHLFAAARAAVGEGTVTARPGSLGSVLDELCARFPSFAAVRPRCSYLLDEVACTDAHAVVGPGSRIDVLPPFAGG